MVYYAEELNMPQSVFEGRSMSPTQIAQVAASSPALPAYITNISAAGAGAARNQTTTTLPPGGLNYSQAGIGGGILAIMKALGWAGTGAGVVAGTRALAPTVAPAVGRIGTGLAAGGAVGGALGIDALGPGGLIPDVIDIPGFGAPPYGVGTAKTWFSGRQKFFMLDDGSICTRKKNGVWKRWRPYKSCVLGKSPSVAQIRKAANKLNTLAKSLSTVLKITTPTRRRRRK